MRLPGAGRPRDVTVVVVHGGFWRERYDRSHAGCQAQAFADAGYPVAVLEYRRTGMPGGGWPGTAEDVAAGVAAVLADPDCLTARSSSGTRPAATSSRGRRASPGLVGCVGVVSLAGVLDLRAAHEQHLGDGAVAAFMGGTPEQLPEAYAAADPCALTPRAPVSIVHGLDDDVVPVASRPLLRGPRRGTRGRAQGGARGRRVRALRAHRPRAPGVRGGPGCGRRARLIVWAP